MIKHLKSITSVIYNLTGLLVYKVQDNELILLLFATGSHSDLFKNIISDIVSGKQN